MGRYVVAGAILFSLIGMGNAFAFGTISGLGQNREHERITRHALACAHSPGTRNCFEPSSIDELAGRSGTFGGVGAPDNPTRGLMSSSAAHCDNGDFLSTPGYANTAAAAQATLESCKTMMDANMNAAVTDARAMLLGNGTIDDSQMPTVFNCTFNGTKGRAKCNVLEGFGLTLHASEDFYSHTNWTDRSDPLRAIGPANPPGLGNSVAAAWLDLRFTSPFPRGLISGCFAGIPESFFCNTGGGRAKHEFINKDKGQIDPAIGTSTTDRGRIQDNFRRSVEAAIADTQDKWLTLQERLISRYGIRDGNLMICALSHDNPIKTCKPGTSSQSATFRSISLIFLLFLASMAAMFGGSLSRGGRGGRAAPRPAT